MKTKTLKQIARLGFMKEFGFAPSLSQIVILEADDFGSYIMVRIDWHEYQIYRKLQRYEMPTCIGAEYVYTIEKYERSTK